MQIPEEWPWEEAKKLFENPDVTPAEQVDVSVCVSYRRDGPDVR